MKSADVARLTSSNRRSNLEETPVEFDANPTNDSSPNEHDFVSESEPTRDVPDGTVGSPRPTDPETMAPPLAQPPSIRALLHRSIDLEHPLPYVSVYQVASYLCRTTVWVYQQIRKGRLRASRWSEGAGELRIKWPDFLAFLEAGEQRARQQEQQKSA